MKAPIASVSRSVGAPAPRNAARTGAVRASRSSRGRGPASIPSRDRPPAPGSAVSDRRWGPTQPCSAIEQATSRPSRTMCRKRALGKASAIAGTYSRFSGVHSAQRRAPWCRAMPSISKQEQIAGAAAVGVDLGPEARAIQPRASEELTGDPGVQERFTAAGAREIAEARRQQVEDVRLGVILREPARREQQMVQQRRARTRAADHEHGRVTGVSVHRLVRRNTNSLQPRPRPDASRSSVKPRVRHASNTSSMRAAS